MRAGLPVVVVVVAVALFAAPGVVAARAIVVVPVVAEGALDDEDRFELGEAVSVTLRERGHDVLGPVEATERVGERDPGCASASTPECWLRAAEQMGRDAVVTCRAQRDSSTGMASVVLRAIDARDGRELAESSRGGAGTARPALLALARIATSQLSDELPAVQRHPRLRVESEPSGAALSVNGSPVGLTPWSAEVAMGATVVRAELAGFRSAVREVTLYEGQNRTLTLLLERDQGAAAGGRAAWQLPVGIAAMAVGALGLGVGLYELARDSCVEEFADGRCRRQMSTGERVGLGVVPTTLGLALVATGVVVGLVLDLGSS